MKSMYAGMLFKQSTYTLGKGENWDWKEEAADTTQ